MQKTYPEFDRKKGKTHLETGEKNLIISLTKTAHY